MSNNSERKTAIYDSLLVLRLRELIVEHTNCSEKSFDILLKESVKRMKSTKASKETVEEITERADLLSELISKGISKKEKKVEKKEEEIVLRKSSERF